MASAPPLSIGLPVRNGMPYLARSLGSILQQSYADFELVVCDNASTDETEEVVRQAARDDSRIRYLRSDNDLGASANFNRCVAETSGALFSWAASDDLFLPRYLERCVEQLSCRPEHAMCVPGVQFIDEEGRSEDSLSQPEALASPDVRARLGSYLDRRSWHMVYGLVRRDDLLKTRLFLPRFGPDVIMMWELLLRRPVATLDETLLAYRRYRVKAASVVWRGLQPDSGGDPPRWPHLELFGDLFKCCGRDDLDARTRVAGRAALMRWAASVHLRDLVVDDLRDEFRRPGRHRTLAADASLVAAMALLRPGRAIKVARRQAISTTLSAAAEPSSESV